MNDTNSQSISSTGLVRTHDGALHVYVHGTNGGWFMHNHAFRASERAQARILEMKVQSAGRINPTLWSTMERPYVSPPFSA